MLIFLTAITALTYLYNLRLDALIARFRMPPNLVRLQFAFTPEATNALFAEWRAEHSDALTRAIHCLRQDLLLICSYSLWGVAVLHFLADCSASNTPSFWLCLPLWAGIFDTLEDVCCFKMLTAGYGVAPFPQLTTVLALLKFAGLILSALLGVGMLVR